MKASATPLNVNCGSCEPQCRVDALYTSPVTVSVKLNVPPSRLITSLRRNSTRLAETTERTEKKIPTPIDDAKKRNLL